MQLDFDIISYQNAFVLAYGFLLVSILLGLLLRIKTLWKFRIFLSAIISILTGVSAGLIVVSQIGFIEKMLIVTLLGYRVFSLFRVVMNRINDRKLRPSVLRSELYLSYMILGLLILVYFQDFTNHLSASFVLLLGLIQLFVYLMFYINTKKIIKISKLTQPKRFRADKDLPSVSVVIPARNEDQHLTDCLNSILASNYPKLEVLVLDDCSQDKTSEIIKKFAHQGVRFVGGEVTNNDWLVKNHAYHKLLDEAGGRFVLFCGVDVRFEPDSIRNVIEQMLNHNTKVMGVAPTHISLKVADRIIQISRYWQEFAIIKPFARTKPILSTCWVTERKFMNDKGGFMSCKKAIRPEKIYAQLANDENNYSLVSSKSGIGIYTTKTIKQQINTAVRVKYPELKNRPENVFIETMEYAFAVLGVVFVLGYGLYSLDLFIIAVAVITATVALLVHKNVLSITYVKPGLMSYLVLPISLFSNLIIGNYSMWAYEFSKVIWKGRNVCMPVLTAIPRLPSVDQDKSL